MNVECVEVTPGRNQTDAPLAFCPECHAKVIYATKSEPVKRIKGLIQFFEENNLNEEAKFYKEQLKAIE